MGEGETPPRPVTEAVVEAIIGEPCPVLRNLQVTVAYWRLAEEFSRQVGPDDAPWVQFAAWTSEDVGAVIRGERTDRSWFLRLVRRLRSDYDERAAEASAAFSRGNTAVFAEVGAAVARFHAVLRDGERAGAMERFLEDLAATPHAPDLVDPPVTLRDAFSAYASALACSGVARARAIALGNLCLAAVEQDRVQSEVEEAFGVFTRGLPPGGLRHRLTVRLVTELALEVTMGEVTFRPGKGLPAGDPPGALQDLATAEGFGRFRALLSDRRPNADDWTRLEDRLAFIAALMRRQQQAPGLLGSSPIPADERSQIEAGVLPERFAHRRAPMAGSVPS